MSNRSFYIKAIMSSLWSKAHKAFIKVERKTRWTLD